MVALAGNRKGGDQVDVSGVTLPVPAFVLGANYEHEGPLKRQVRADCTHKTCQNERQSPENSPWALNPCLTQPNNSNHVELTVSVIASMFGWRVKN